MPTLFDIRIEIQMPFWLINNDIIQVYKCLNGSIQCNNNSSSAYLANK